MLAGSWVAAQVGPTNLKRGQALYEGHCAGCHGQNGDGLGPDAQYLVVPPANFKSTRTTTKTDGKLLMSNSNGVLFSPMHAWRDRLSEQEMKDIIDYLRMLSPFNPIS
jgi:mono/diheme cytochrome c family protein